MHTYRSQASTPYQAQRNRQFTMDGKNRNCPKCKHEVRSKMKGQPWPLLLCEACLNKKKPKNYAKQQDRIERRLKGGIPLSLGLLKFQAEVAPAKPKNPTLGAEDLPADVRTWLDQVSLSVERLEALPAPYGHALLALNSTDTLQTTSRASESSTYIKREDSAESEDTKLPRAARGQGSNKTLFIGGLHREVKKTMLAWFFKDYVHDIPFVRHNWKVKGRGKAVEWALVEMDTPSEAARAIRELDGKELLDCKVSVHFHTPRASVKPFDPQVYTETGRTLYIRGIEPDVTEDMLLTFMDDFEARVHMIKNDYAIVEVSSSAEAQRAIDWLDKQRILKRLLRVQINRNKWHEPVPDILTGAPRALTPIYKLQGDDEQKFLSTFDQDEVKQEEPRQSEYFAPQAYFSGRAAISTEHPPVKRLGYGIKREGDVDMSDVDSMSQVSDAPSTGDPPREIGVGAGGGGEWIAGVLSEILQMEMASRPSSWLDVSMSVQRELQHQLMRDITEGDPREGTPISVPLLELLDARVEELRQIQESQV
ncbi:uncharacterized protein CLAFUR5_06157 [Fulvia fulva]|uniref:RRM domain-containing protein n=1 Tax=Passalora fulva TaxID=5499 RepID=A0A9Q8P9K7_PASFU|nr:uncharacterized protein CLAFUR5_06157 [Fulvia fulva]KAK4624890.1 hypothetical protein CLAFUR0_06021 [Fulvia fulva]UJO18046.1 hypothetical protein CLAFUR5_06157 [Fulvia fulva]